MAKILGIIRIAYALDIDHHEYFGVSAIKADDSVVVLQRPEGHDQRAQIDFLEANALDLGYLVCKRQFDSVNPVEAQEFLVNAKTASAK